jgi:hypothetical protein
MEYSVIEGMMVYYNMAWHGGVSVVLFLYKGCGTFLFRAWNGGREGKLDGGVMLGDENGSN